MDIRKIIALSIIGILFLTLLMITVALILKAKKKPEVSVGYGMPSEALATMAAVKEQEAEVGIEKEPEYIQLLKIAEENPQLLANLIKSWMKE